MIFISLTYNTEGIVFFYRTAPTIGKEEKMITGILKEIKTEEYRVSMTPAGVEIMKNNGHTVLVEKNAGIGSGADILT